MINDNAERGVALIQEYNSIITNDEELKQYLPGPGPVRGAKVQNPTWPTQILPTGTLTNSNFAHWATDHLDQTE